MIISLGLNIRKPDELKSIEADVILSKIKDSVVLHDAITLIRVTHDKDRKKELKALLPYMVAGVFNGKRANNAFVESSLFVFDLDHVCDCSKSLREYNSIFEKVCENAFTHFAFMSPSGDGIKFGIKLVKPIKTVEEYSRAYRHCADKISKALRMDCDNTSDPARACFLSYDWNLYHAKDSALWIPQTEEPKQTQRQYTPKYTEADKADKDWQRCEMLARTAYISDYAMWIEAGLALKSHYGERGLILFKLLSLNKGSKDTERDIERKWNTFPTRSACGIGTFIKLCKDNGGRDD